MSKASERRSLEEVKKLLQSLEDASASEGTEAAPAQPVGPRSDREVSATITSAPAKVPSVGTQVSRPVPSPLTTIELSSAPTQLPLSTTVSQPEGSSRRLAMVVVVMLAAAGVGLLLYDWQSGSFRTMAPTTPHVIKVESAAAQPAVVAPVAAPAGSTAPMPSERIATGSKPVEPLPPSTTDAGAGSLPVPAKDRAAPPATASPEQQPVQAVGTPASTAPLTPTSPAAVEAPPKPVLTAAPAEAKPEPQPPTPPVVPAVEAAKPPPTVNRRLRVAPSLTAHAGRSQPFPITAEGFPSGSAIVVSGLPPGASLSAGAVRPGDLWTLTLSDVERLQLTLTHESSGRHELVVELRSPTAELLASARTALTISAQATAPGREMADPARLDETETVRLLTEGKSRLSGGHVAPARLLFRRAADAGNGEAARLLGDTYDPAKLYALGVRGTSGDIDIAIYWYERADELGDPHAKSRLLALGGR